MYSEPIFSTPWQCHDSDCGGGGWHLGTFWSPDYDAPAGTSAGTYDAYTDGDHEQIEEGDGPTEAEHDKGWAAYYAYCAATGTDPLVQLYVSTSITRRQRWQVRINRTFKNRPVLVWGRRSGRGDRLPAAKLPADLVAYLCLDDELTFSSLCELAVEDQNVTVHRAGSGWALDGLLITVALDITTPRSLAAVSREITRTARRNAPDSRL